MGEVFRIVQRDTLRFVLSQRCHEHSATPEVSVRSGLWGTCQACAKHRQSSAGLCRGRSLSLAKFCPGLVRARSRSRQRAMNCCELRAILLSASKLRKIPPLTVVRSAALRAKTHGYRGGCTSSCLAEFHSRYPEIEVAIEVTERVVDLINSYTHVPIRFGALPDGGLLQRPLSRAEWRCGTYKWPSYIIGKCACLFLEISTQLPMNNAFRWHSDKSKITHHTVIFSPL